MEAARCFEEGVITDPREADVGAILGRGFAPWTGGLVSLIDGVGVAKFVEARDALAPEARPRCHPPQAAARHGGQGETFYGRFGVKAKAAALMAAACPEIRPGALCAGPFSSAASRRYQ